MIIRCDNCSAKFRLDDNKVTESGVKVRCKRCQHIFVVRKERPQGELEALPALQPEESPVQIPPSEQPPVPPETSGTEDEAAPSPLQEQQIVPPKEETTPAADEADEFTLSVAPAPGIAAVSGRDSSRDEFSFSFAPLPPEEPHSDEEVPETGVLPVEEASAPEEPAFPPDSDDNFGFTFEKEPLPVRAPPAPVPVSMESAAGAEWGEVEVRAETAPAIEDEGAVSGKEELPDASGWDRFDSFKTEPPQPDALPGESLPEPEPLLQELPPPAPADESAGEEPFDFTEWSPGEPDSPPAAPPAPEATVEETGQPVSPSMDQWSSEPPAESAPPLPLAAAEPAPPAAEEPHEEELATAPAAGDVVTDDTFSFTVGDPPPVAPPRKGLPFITMVSLLLAAIVLMIVGGGGALYLLKGPEAFKAVGLDGVARLLDGESAVQERILIRTVEGSYLNNSEAGELFVIRGVAVNSYKSPRAALQIRGMIYNAAGAVILQKVVYCGNPLPPERLATLPLAKIEEAMNNRLGESYANIGVPPGKSIPFVIVFSKMPKEAVDFAVELAGSQPSGQ